MRNAINTFVLTIIMMVVLTMVCIGSVVGADTTTAVAAVVGGCGVDALVPVSAEILAADEKTAAKEKDAKAKAEAVALEMDRKIAADEKASVVRELALGESRKLGSSELLFEKDRLILKNNGAEVWMQPIANGVKLVMQADGNLVVYAADGLPVWSAQTAGAEGAVLRLQADGNLVVLGRCENIVLWDAWTATANRSKSSGSIGRLKFW